MAHFIFLTSVGNTRLFFLSADSALRHPPPPQPHPPIYTVHRLSYNTSAE